MRAKKSLGQNFLQDASIVRRIVDALDLISDDVVVEIGPGHGALSEVLISKGAHVVAVEFDRDLVAPLKIQFGASSNFKLIHADALHFDFNSVSNGPAPVKLVANLPYNISTPILQRLIEQKETFSSLVLMFQREVVERIAAKPGDSDRGYLTVMTENSFDVEKLFDVPPEAFRPIPRVWSAVVRLTPKVPSTTNEAALRRIVSAGFAQKRKTIQNNLKTLISDAARVLAACNVDPNRRAETLTLEEWGRLAAALSPDAKR